MGGLPSSLLNTVLKAVKPPAAVWRDEHSLANSFMKNLPLIKKRIKEEFSLLLWKGRQPLGLTLTEA